MKKKKPKSQTKRKVITSRDGERFRILRKTEKPKRIKYEHVRERKEKVRRYFREVITPRFHAFVNRTHKSKKKYIFSIRHTKKIRGLKRRIDGGFSFERVDIQNARQFNEVMRDYENDFLTALERYLNRKDVLQLNIHRIDMEVTLETLRPVSTKRPKRKKRKKSKPVRRRRRRK